jgi:arginine decarboxylase
VEDVLSYVEFDPKEMRSRFREKAEQAVQDGLITAKQRREIIGAYDDGLRGYTYYER